MILQQGFFYHGWDESREQKWSNPETGCSPNFGVAVSDGMELLL